MKCGDCMSDCINCDPAGTTYTGQPQTLTHESIKKLEEEWRQVEAKMPKDWLLISPDGKYWKGSLKDILMTVAQERFKSDPLFIERNIT